LLAVAASANNRQGGGFQGGWEGVPFQFPHRRYQTAW
jgi:hypothetical protein